MSSPARFNMTRLRCDLAECESQKAALLAALCRVTDRLHEITAAYEPAHPDTELVREGRAAIAKAQP